MIGDQVYIGVVVAGLVAVVMGLVLHVRSGRELRLAIRGLFSYLPMLLIFEFFGLALFVNKDRENSGSAPAPEPFLHLRP